MTTRSAALWTAALAVAATTLLAGCSGGSSDSAAAALDAQAKAAAPGALEASSAPGVAGGTPGGASGRSQSATLTTQAQIRTAEISIRIKRAQDVATKADVAGDLAVSRGGRIDSDRRTSGEYASATLVLRVPPDELSATLRGLARLGHVTSRDATTRDVTSQVADVSSRVTSAQRAIARLRVLYDNAPKVSDVIAIEQELSSRESDLESMQAQQRTLAGRVSLATVTVSLQAAPRTVTPPKHDDRSGFLGGLANGWDAFTRAATGVATGLGAALPFLALLLVLAAAARVVVVRRRRPQPVPVSE